jgi:hypothetical protein
VEINPFKQDLDKGIGKDEELGDVYYSTKKMAIVLEMNIICQVMLALVWYFTVFYSDSSNKSIFYGNQAPSCEVLIQNIKQDHSNTHCD